MNGRIISCFEYVVIHLMMMTDDDDEFVVLGQLKMRKMRT